MKTSTRCYSELITLPTFEERYEYLKLNGIVGEPIWHDRWLNQVFYKSWEWRKFRRGIILRDKGCDLGIEDRVIEGFIRIHHINPVDREDIIRRNISVLMNPENTICTSLNTHNAIHFGDASLLITAPIERSKHDTCPWRRE